MKASFNGHLPVTEALIQAKADVNACNVSSCLITVFVNHTRPLEKLKTEVPECINVELNQYCGLFSIE